MHGGKHLSTSGVPGIYVQPSSFAEFRIVSFSRSLNPLGETSLETYLEKNDETYASLFLSVEKSPKSSPRWLNGSCDASVRNKPEVAAHHFFSGEFAAIIFVSGYVSGDLIPTGSKLFRFMFSVRPVIVDVFSVKLAILSLSPPTRSRNQPLTSRKILLPAKNVAHGACGSVQFSPSQLAGTQANWALMAILTVQVYKHQTQYPNEPRWIKALVYLIFLLEVAQTGVSSHYAYSVLSLSWGDPTIFVRFLWSTLATPIFSGLSSDDMDYRRKILRAIVTFWLIDTVVCDALITISMIFILYQYRQQTPWKHTDTIIVRLMANTLENGAITSTGALLNPILFLAYPENNLNEIPYANVLLFTLSMRRSQESRRSTNLSGENLDDSHELQLRRSHLQNPDERRPQKVHITTDVTSDALSDRDGDSKMGGV
ncbi:hypothetical protein B0H14DRAFT_2638469 [Mycena olivaceomarginata]|nr:hypothetical protein B0H14DRAFT_2638469 [Mycena olivaceomarginata]